MWHQNQHITQIIALILVQENSTRVSLFNIYTSKFSNLFISVQRMIKTTLVYKPESSWTSFTSVA
jgi:hypothetical protein